MSVKRWWPCGGLCLSLLVSGCAGKGTELTGDGGGTDNTDAGPPSDGGSDGGGATTWLHTSGNHILRADGTVWHARGANLMDTRSCDACTFAAPDVDEVLRRADDITDSWGANLVRLDLESYASSGGRTQWQPITADAEYFQDIQTIVAHLTSKPGVYVLVSEWLSPTFSTEGWPTAATATEWTQLATAFANNPKVLYGLCNEPQNNEDGSEDAQVWQAMSQSAAAIRAAEADAGTAHHIITAQGTGGWARRLDYYVTHPLDTDNVAYEVHVYDPQTSFQTEFITPATTIPVLIGEFGPAAPMTTTDTLALMQTAEQLEIPYIGWAFHMRCPPNLLDDNSSGGCGVGMTLTASSPWGTQIQTRLAMPW